MFWRPCLENQRIYMNKVFTLENNTLKATEDMMHFYKKNNNLTVKCIQKQSINMTAFLESSNITNI